MKQFKLTLISSFFILGFIALFFSSNSGGITGVSTTGCTCHGSSSNATMISFSGIPSTGWVAGTAYTVTLTVSNSNASLVNAGFDFYVTQGTFSNPAAGTSIVTAANEIKHTSPQTLISGSASWTFTWTAPSTPTSSLAIFHCSGNCTNANGGTSGDTWFKTNFPHSQQTAPSNPPTISTTSINSITSSGATINGIGNANGTNTGVSVEYGLTTSYGSTAVATPAIITGTNNTTISSSLSGLTPNTLYHVRYKASSTGGTVYSPDSTFTTLGIVPTISLSNITSITTNSASINGVANANNSSSTITVEYGLTTSYGMTANATPNIITGTANNNETVMLSGLTSNTLYHVRYKAVNSTGTSYSADSTFTTLPTIVTNPPNISITSINSISATGATINGIGNANNLSTTVSVEYGLTTSYGLTANATPNIITGSSNNNETVALIGLTPNTTYHVRYKAANSLGTTYSADSTFKTLFANSISSFEKAGLKLYPNPSTNTITIESKNDLILTVYNSLGAKQNVIFEKNKIGYQFLVNHLANGIYYIKASKNTQTMISTFIKE